MPDYALMNQCLYEGKAKEIEQQQIENSFDAGVSSVTKNFDKAYSDIDGEEYYKQNFEQQEKCITYEKDI